MGIATYPAAAGGGIKSVQRGLASGAGNVTITAVDITKSFVNVYGTASSGTVAASGSINAANGNNASGTDNFRTGYGNVRNLANYLNSLNGTAALVGVISSKAITLNATNISGGSNNLVSAIVQGYLSNSTTLVVSGACRWEVVEFN